MEEETTRGYDIWVLQESTVISAQSHDIWSFTPEFLANDVAPEEWKCRRATRTGDTVEIEHGPIDWRITPSELSITLEPDLPLEPYEAEHKEQPITPTLAHNFLTSAPYTPVHHMWFYWQFSILKPNTHQWMLKKFLANEPPAGLVPVKLQPRLTFSLDELAVQVTVRNDPVQRQNEIFNNAIIFECFINRIEDLTIDDMVADTSCSVEQFGIVRKAINHLMVEESSQ